VQPPKGELEHIHYFCGNTENEDDLRATEPQRVALYKSVVALVRAYANIADDMQQAGFSAFEIERIKKDLFFIKLVCLGKSSLMRIRSTSNANFYYYI
jgi:type I restriction enzyme R subunit